MVRPILEYASPIWDPYQQTDIKSLEQVQRRAARYVFNDYSTITPGSVTKMLDDLEWEPLEVRRRHDRLSMLYRMQHNLVDIPANRYLSSSDSRTRGTVKFFQENLLQLLLPKDCKRMEQIAIQSCDCSLPGRLQVIPTGVTCSINGIREVTVHSFNQPLVLSTCT